MGDSSRAHDAVHHDSVASPGLSPGQTSPSALLYPGLLIVAAGVLLPLLVVIIASLSEPQAWGGVEWGKPSLRAFLHVVAEEDFDGIWHFNGTFASIALRTVAMSAIATSLCLLLGFPAALLISMQTPRLRAFLVILVTVPFWSSLVVRLYAWILILRDGGVMASLLRVLGLPVLPPLLYSHTATIIGLTYAFIPFMVLPIHASIEQMNRDLVDASLDLGASPTATVLQVILPLAMPGVVAGSLLVFVSSLGAYLIPDMLGGAKSMMLGNLVNLQFGAGRDWPLGAALALVLCGLTLASSFAVRRTAQGLKGWRLA
jgi:spermidine/putrescine transport system permease protein